MYRAIAKRHAITGPRLDRYAETWPAPGFQRGRVGPVPEIIEQTLHENFQPDLD